MLNKVHRPKTFDDLIGQDVPKKIMKTVAINPINKPGVYIFSGPFGSGKTSLARIFGRAINCKGSNPPCFNCKSCLSYLDILDDSRYQELDSAMVGNVSDVKSYRESWFFSPSKDYKVVTIDEGQVVSTQAQAALLSVMENPPDRTFFIFCTTDVDKILPPLVSRSFEVEFNLLSPNDIQILVQMIAEKEGFSIDLESIELIKRRSRGHARDAVKLLDRFLILSQEEFKSSVIVADRLFLDFFKAAFSLKKDLVRDSINRMSNVPIVILNEDLESFMLKMMDSVILDSKILWGRINESLMVKIFKLYIQFSSVLGKSTSDFGSFFYMVYSLIMRENTLPSINKVNDRFKKN